MLVIPDFPRFGLVEGDHGWSIVRVATGEVLGGSQSPGKARRFKLSNDEGCSNRTLEGWLHHAGVTRSEQSGHGLPGMPDHRVDRRPDGRWGVRSVRGASRRADWLSERGGLVRVFYGGTSYTYPLVMLVAKALLGPPAPGAVLQVDHTVPPERWPEGLSWVTTVMVMVP